VKGSGKTSLLESLRFVLGGDVPQGRLQPVNEHLSAILGPAGKVSALVKRSDGAKVLIERSIADKTFLVTFDNDRQERITRPESLHFPAYILGWHEIEQAATDGNSRRLYMDSIAGKEQVRSLTEEAEVLCTSIRSQHERAANVYATYKQLEQQVARLKELRKGLQELRTPT
jgi:DNA repair exonuclease SbcCD ATPase subunit